MTEGSRRPELADFLRTRRARLTPETVGLPGGTHRRTPGLRREEVALLANVGLTWYTFLEQGRPIKVSEQTLERVAEALRLAPPEVAHLFDLADRPHARLPDDEHVPAGVSAVIESLGPLPVFVVNRCFDILAWNRAARLVWVDVAAIPEMERNLVWLLFGNAQLSGMLGDAERHARRLIAQFRFSYGQNQDDPRFAQVIERCGAVSPRFRELWAGHEVDDCAGGEVALQHPVAGRLVFDTTVFHPGPAPSLRAGFAVPRPGTGTREAVLALMESDAQR